MRNLLLRNVAFPLFLITLFYQTVPCQPIDSIRQPGIFDRLLEDDLPEITITIDLDTLLGDIRRTEYVQGEFEFKKNKNKRWNLPVKVRPRGRFRRMKCSFPPLKLKFKKDDLAEQGLNDYNEFKLVTHCLEDDLRSKEMIVKEFIVYKMLNVLTKYSFRVQLVKVTYRHSERKDKIKQWGILIEDLEDLSHRNDGQVVSRIGIPLDSIHENQEKLASLFQFMVGNIDWSYLLARNIEFVRLPSGELVPIPYDFDYSGFVNAPYAAPDRQVGQETVRDRVYLGNAASHQELRAMFSYFKMKKPEILETISECRHLSGEVKTDLLNYLGGFFELLENEEFAAELLFQKKAVKY